MSGRSAVVAAHPDDEILWLSSAMQAARPCRPVLWRALRQAGKGGCAPPGGGRSAAAQPRQPRDPRKRHAAAGGLAPSGDDTDRHGHCRRRARQRYDDNFNTLLAELRPVLAGCADVYTHNPWGEYGHPEHIQVYRAVTALQAELGFTVWFSN